MPPASTQNISHSGLSAQNTQILTFSSQYIILRIIRKCGLGGVWDRCCWPHPWPSCSRILFSSIQRLPRSSRTLFSSIQRVLGTSLVTLGGNAKSTIFVMPPPPWDRPQDPRRLFCYSSASSEGPEHYFRRSNASSEAPEHYFRRPRASPERPEHCFRQSSTSLEIPEYYFCRSSGSSEPPGHCLGGSNASRSFQKTGFGKPPRPQNLQKTVFVNPAPPRTSRMVCSVFQGVLKMSTTMLS